MLCLEHIKKQCVSLVSAQRPLNMHGKHIVVALPGGVCSQKSRNLMDSQRFSNKILGAPTFPSRQSVLPSRAQQRDKPGRLVTIWILIGRSRLLFFRRASFDTSLTASLEGVGAACAKQIGKNNVFYMFQPNDLSPYMKNTYFLSCLAASAHNNQAKQRVLKDILSKYNKNQRFHPGNPS